ncbi:MAG: hypothetical protein WHT08_01000 [Bryobacteraceae bacterium]
MIFLASALLLQAGLFFSEIHPWRWSDGRGEYIPALSAVIENRTGQDFASARLRVRIHCREGGDREYTVQVRDILLGQQAVEATAFDSIGSVSWCDGRAEIEPLELHPYPPEMRPGFVVFGFSRLEPGQPVRTNLLGVLDYRKQPDQQQTVELRTWNRHGARFEIEAVPHTAFYMIRVPPGRMGLAGFVLEPDEPRGPLSRFLRFYDVPPGKAAYLGIFRLEQERPGRTAVVLDPAPDLLPKLAELLPRPVERAQAVAPPPGSTLVLP